MHAWYANLYCTVCCTMAMRSSRPVCAPVPRASHGHGHQVQRRGRGPTGLCAEVRRSTRTFLNDVDEVDAVLVGDGGDDVVDDDERAGAPHPRAAVHQQRRRIVVHGLASIADVQEHVRHVVRIHAPEAVGGYTVVRPRDEPEVLHISLVRALLKEQPRVLVPLAQLGAGQGDGDTVELPRARSANHAWEVALALALLVLDEVCRLHNELDIVLPDHADERGDGGRQGALCGNVRVARDVAACVSCGGLRHPVPPDVICIDIRRRRVHGDFLEGHCSARVGQDVQIAVELLAAVCSVDGSPFCRTNVQLVERRDVDRRDEEVDLLLERACNARGHVVGGDHADLCRAQTLEHVGELHKRHCVDTRAVDGADLLADAQHARLLERRVVDGLDDTALTAGLRMFRDFDPEAVCWCSLQMYYFDSVWPAWNTTCSRSHSDCHWRHGEYQPGAGTSGVLFFHCAHANG
eukprot:m.291445 g.291445  ORF g.291445 m.291445 type:complete len:464 (-) comp19976_c0_seq74:1420-2811(-)